MTTAVLETTDPPGIRPVMAAASASRPLRRSAVPVREPRAASRVIQMDGDRRDLDPPGTLRLLLPLEGAEEADEAEWKAAGRRRSRSARREGARKPGVRDQKPDHGRDVSPGTGMTELESTDLESTDLESTELEYDEWAGRDLDTVQARRPASVRRGPSARGARSESATGPAPEATTATELTPESTSPTRSAGSGRTKARAGSPGDGRVGSGQPGASGGSRSPAVPGTPYQPWSRAEGILGLPEPRGWAGTFLQAAMEAALGIRSPSQLVRWTTPEVHGLLVRRGSLAMRAHRGGTSSAKPRIRALLSCVPREGICEVGAVVAETDRVRAVAFRMEGLHGRWRVTELVIG